MWEVRWAAAAVLLELDPRTATRGTGEETGRKRKQQTPSLAGPSTTPPVRLAIQMAVKMKAKSKQRFVQDVAQYLCKELCKDQKDGRTLCYQALVLADNLQNKRPREDSGCSNPRREPRQVQRKFQKLFPAAGILDLD